MLQRTKVQLLLLALLAAGLYGCIKSTSISPLPVIAFKEFQKFAKDSAYLTITFKDGDGDIGRLNLNDTTPPYNANGAYAYDLVMLYYYKGADGNFHRYYSALQNDSIQQRFHIPYITPNGQNKTLNGEIRTILNAPYYVVGALPAHTIIRYDIYIFDRAFHKSNVISTPEIPVP
jgi:hypothetical protein